MGVRGCEFQGYAEGLTFGLEGLGPALRLPDLGCRGINLSGFEGCFCGDCLESLASELEVWDLTRVPSHHTLLASLTYNSWGEADIQPSGERVEISSRREVSPLTEASERLSRCAAFVKTQSSLRRTPEGPTTQESYTSP